MRDAVRANPAPRRGWITKGRPDLGPALLLCPPRVSAEVDCYGVATFTPAPSLTMTAWSVLFMLMLTRAWLSPLAVSANPPR